ncbi:MAG: 6-bladed beta-propeller [Prevotellaceae bacterium]|nr:6-bladed beta-propeller [Prevotellaceae bacterium]
MKRIVIICFISILVFSCNKRNDRLADYKFDKDNAVDISQIKIEPEIDIALETTESAISPSYANLCMDKDNFFLYAQNTIIRYDREGHPVNKIGSLGHGKGEFIEVNDIFVNENDKTVEVLAPGAVYTYDYSGKFIAKKAVGIEAVSFVCNNGKYWFSTEHNRFDTFALFRTNKNFDIEEKFLDAEYGIPIKENNFGKGTVLTYKESFIHDIYRIEQDNLVLTYRLEFTDLEIPSNLFKGEVEEIMNKMNQNNYAVVHCFLENENYIYMLVDEYMKDEEINAYHWIINKTANKDMIIKLDNSALESFHYNPQILTEQNIVYFVGYPTENEDVNENPHITGIDLSKII